MLKSLRLTLIAVILIAGLPAIPAMAQGPTLPPNCAVIPTGNSVALICMPVGTWNHDLVVYAHGYVDPTQPIGIPFDQVFLPDGTFLPGLVNSLGYAFAMSSYSKNGLAVLPGLQDTLNLVQAFKDSHRDTGHVYLVGASEGGLITTLGVERSLVFNGGLATCGPVGDFRKQINYWGDFRVVFDYFFPDVFTPHWTMSAIRVPEEVQKNWKTVYVPKITAALVANPHAAEQLIRVTQAPVDRADQTTIAETVVGLLWYSAFATNDGIDTLGGKPFDNQSRWYIGSDNDWKLNRQVARFRADALALSNMAQYQTSGKLPRPLVTLHTTGDPIVPYWHEPLYRLKVWNKGSALMYSNIPILRYGHCSFEAPEVLAGFALMVLKVTGQELVNAHTALPSADAQMKFKQLAVENGALK